MADQETSTSSTELHPPGANEGKPTGDADLTDEERDKQTIEMIVERKTRLSKSVTKVISRLREGPQSIDVPSLEVELGRAQKELTEVKHQLNGYRLRVIEKEKQVMPELSIEQLQLGFNRDQRLWLSFRRELLREENQLREKRGEQLPEQDSPDEKQKEQECREKTAVGLKRLMGRAALLEDDLTFSIQRNDEGETPVARKRAVAFHLEQLVWHQRMLVWNLEELLTGRVSKVCPADQEKLVMGISGVVDAQLELVKQQKDFLNQRKKLETKFEMQEIPRKKLGYQEELYQLIVEQTRLVDICPTHVPNRDVPVRSTDLMMEEFASINIRWEAIFGHQGLTGDKKQPLQKRVVESAEMLRQQVYGLRVKHHEFYQPLEIAVHIEEEILLKQTTYWEEIIQQQQQKQVTEKSRQDLCDLLCEPSARLELPSTCSPQPYASGSDVRKPDRADHYGIEGSRSGEELQAFHKGEKELSYDDDNSLLDSNDDSLASSLPSMSSTPTSEQPSQGNPSEQPTRLQWILKEHEKLTAEFSDSERMESIFQLPYIAIAYFDENGGSLSLDPYNVHLYIPRGALPESHLQQVYIYVDPRAPPFDGFIPPDVALSPVVQCGPSGLKFLDRVVLSFPHCAKEGTGWQLSARICSDDDTASNTWKAFDGDDDGIVVSTKDNKVVLLMSHFCGAALAGQPAESSAKRVKIGAFGGLLDSREDWYSVRVHVWNDEPAAKQNVRSTENDLDPNSKPLDVYKDFEVYYNQADVKAELKNVTDGWQVEDTHVQTISKTRIWRNSTNSVTFDLTRRQHCERSLRCEGFVYQTAPESTDVWKGDEVRLLIRPPKAVISTSTDMQTRPLGDLCGTCDKGGVPNICVMCKENLNGAFAKKEPGRMDGDYGGLSADVVERLCRFLGTGQEGWQSLKQFADDLCDDGNRLLDIVPAREVLKLFFAGRRETRMSDQEAVDRLVRMLRHLEDAARIVRENMGTPDSKCLKRDATALTDLPDVAEEEYFWHLARELGAEWEELSTHLGFKKAELYKITVDVKRVDGQIFEMLNQWRHRGGTVGDLVEGLRKVERFDLAEQLDGRKKLCITNRAQVASPS